MFDMAQNMPLDMYSIKKKAVPKYFAIFTGTHLRWSLFSTKKRCFPVNIAKFLRAPILKNICEWLFMFFTFTLFEIFEFVV